MPKIADTDFRVVIDAFSALGIVIFVTATFVGAEAYLTNGKMIASAEIENGCAPCSASMALATRNNVRVPD